MLAGLDARAEGDEGDQDGDEQGDVGAADEVEDLVGEAGRRGDGVCPTAEEDERDGQQDGGCGANWTGGGRDFFCLRAMRSASIPGLKVLRPGAPRLIGSSLQRVPVFQSGVLPRRWQQRVADVLHCRLPELVALPLLPAADEKAAEAGSGDGGGGQSDDQSPEDGAAQVGVILRRRPAWRQDAAAACHGRWRARPAAAFLPVRAGGRCGARPRPQWASAAPGPPQRTPACPPRCPAPAAPTAIAAAWSLPAARCWPAPERRCPSAQRISYFDMFEVADA
jgi:hypothetical protein